MEERSLKITGTDKTFFNKISLKLTKMLTPTKIGINSMLISIRRNSLLKAFEQFQEKEDEETKEEKSKKYDDTYESYLEALDKYVMDSIYKKVRNNTATEFEKNALSKYYGVISLKENEYIEYKYRKQQYLIDLDFESVKISNKDKLINRYKAFYINKMDTLFKGILKNYSIKLADTTSKYDSSKDNIYNKIFTTLDEYAENILMIKVEKEKNDKAIEKIIPDFEKYEKFTIGKLDSRDVIEKYMILLTISRNLFTHSLPLVVAEQCYEKLLRNIRTLIQESKITTKREKAYSTLINLIEEYKVKLLSTKVYWEDPQMKKEYKNFLNKYKNIENIKETDFIEYIKEKEILFIKYDIRSLPKEEEKQYSKLLKYYKRKLVDYGVMKELKNSCKTEGVYKKVKMIGKLSKKCMK